MVSKIDTVNLLVSFSSLWFGVGVLVKDTRYVEEHTSVGLYN